MEGGSTSGYSSSGNASRSAVEMCDVGRYSAKDAAFSVR